MKWILPNWIEMNYGQSFFFKVMSRWSVFSGSSFLLCTIRCMFAYEIVSLHQTEMQLKVTDIPCCWYTKRDCRCDWQPYCSVCTLSDILILTDSHALCVCRLSEILTVTVSYCGVCTLSDILTVTDSHTVCMLSKIKTVTMVCARYGRLWL